MPDHVELDAATPQVGTERRQDAVTQGITGQTDDHIQQVAAMAGATDPDPNTPESIGEPVDFAEAIRISQASWAQNAQPGLAQMQNGVLYALFDTVRLYRAAYKDKATWKTLYNSRDFERRSRTPETQVVDVMMEKDPNADAISHNMGSYWGGCIGWFATVCAETDRDRAVRAALKNGGAKKCAALYTPPEDSDPRPGRPKGRKSGEDQTHPSTVANDDGSGAEAEAIKYRETAAARHRSGDEAIDEPVAIPPDPLRDALESDTIEDIGEELDVATLIAVIGPEPKPPKERAPKPVSDQMRRFVGALKLAIRGATDGERASAVAAMQNLPDSSAIVEQLADAAEKFGTPSETEARLNYERALAQFWKDYAKYHIAVGEIEAKRLTDLRDKLARSIKNTNRLIRVSSRMRHFIEAVLRDGIPRTRADLDTLLKACSLTRAKAFREWIDRAWTAIEADTTTLPEIILLRERNAALVEAIHDVESHKRDLTQQVRELTERITELENAAERVAEPIA